MTKTAQDPPTHTSRVIADVVDPDLGFSLGELGMIENVSTDKHGATQVDLRVPSRVLADPDRLQPVIDEACHAAQIGSRIQVRTTAMNDQERMQVAQKLKSTSGPAALGSQTRAYAIASGKGGVGKSVVTANLATALANQGQRVGVIDADVWGYSMPQLFGVRDAPAAIKGVMLPVRTHGVRLMSVGFFVEDSEPVVWRGPMLHKALDQFINDVYWGELDTLLLDLPPGTGDVPMSLIDMLPDMAMLLVSTPQPTAWHVAARIGAMAKDSRVPVVGVIENMTGVQCAHCGSHTHIFGESSGDQLANHIDAPLLGRVPLDPQLLQAANEGEPVVASHPTSPAAQSIAQIATTLPTINKTIAGRALPLFVD